jgi:hypothetical protein
MIQLLSNLEALEANIDVFYSLICVSESSIMSKMICRILS